MTCARGYIMPIAAAKSLRGLSEVDRTATETACVLEANPRRAKPTAAKLRYAANAEFVERRYPTASHILPRHVRLAPLPQVGPVASHYRSISERNPPRGLGVVPVWV